MTLPKPDSNYDKVIKDGNLAVQELIDDVRANYPRLPGEDEVYNILEFPGGFEGFLQFMRRVIAATADFPDSEKVTVYFGDANAVHFFVWKYFIDLRVSETTLTIYEHAQQEG